MTVRRFLPVRPLSLAVAAAVLALPPASPAAAAPKVHTIVIDKMKFGPVPAGIRSGDTIIWVNRDFLKHRDGARQKLQRRAAPEDQRKDRDPAFGDDRFLLHLSSRDDGVAECRKIAAVEDAVRCETRNQARLATRAGSPRAIARRTTLAVRAAAGLLNEQ